MVRELKFSIQWIYYFERKPKNPLTSRSSVFGRQLSEEVLLADGRNQEKFLERKTFERIYECAPFNIRIAYTRPIYIIIIIT